MEKFVAGVVAFVLAAFGWILFGKPKGESSQSSETPEAITQPPEAAAPTTLPLEAPASTTVTELPVQVEEPLEFAEITPAPAIESSSPVAQEIADPWAESSEGSITFEASNTEEEEDSERAAEEEAVQLDVDDVTQLVEWVEPEDSPESTPSVRATTARYNTPSATLSPPPIEAPFAAIQDPRRPSSPALQDLSQQILDWGNSKQLSNIPKVLAHANHSDAVIRSYVALALGQIAGPHTVKAEIEKVIPVLGKLSQDSSPDVRQMAIKALSSIQSPDVLPYLEKGLLSASGNIKQVANTAIQKLKLHYGPQGGSSDFPPSLQKKP